ncbi:MAG TPA: cyclopropane-fatty-acyl-phospholipid synthase family protein [Acidimicrobiales bacterium]
MSVADLVATVFNDRLPFRVEAYDGSVALPSIDSGANSVTLKVLNPDAIARIATQPGELGLARAYVAGDIDLDGDLDLLFKIAPPSLRRALSPRLVREVVRTRGVSLLHPPAPPVIEAQPRGPLHSRTRDSQAVTHHYNVSNRFYEMVLGPSMTYSCAVFVTPEDTLEQAQSRKVDLVARKLALQPGQRLLDVGCGWGTMGIHAAQHYGARVLGVTLSEPQQRYATARALAAGVGDLVEFRVQDVRDIRDAPFDAISSIGMAEHVGRRALPAYAQKMWDLLVPGGRFLNHAIGRPVVAGDDPRPSNASELSRQLRIALGVRGPSKNRSAFIDHYVFPDGELHEVGSLISLFQSHGFEVRHAESLREHYAVTLRRWVDNLIKRFDEACEEVGEQRARVWRLYMTGSAVGFEQHKLEVHQVLCVRPDRGASHFPLRSNFEPLF